MTAYEAVWLGIIQGATEFLPVSSSGHLVIAERLLGVRQPGVALEVALHLGTLLAVIVYFRQQLRYLARGVIGLIPDVPERRTARRLFLLLILASVPAAVVGLLLKDRIEEAFASEVFAASMLIVTGLLLLSTVRARVSRARIDPASAWWVGCAQAIAILPGISRSGSTMAVGMMRGISPTEAAEFSFLLSIPAVAGASILTLPDAMSRSQLGMSHLIGGLVAAVTGYAALAFLFAILRRGRLWWFGWYCVGAGTATILVFRL
jgi:undecaprenyl-diphosphatase